MNLLKKEFPEMKKFNLLVLASLLVLGLGFIGCGSDDDGGVDTVQPVADTVVDPADTVVDPADTVIDPADTVVDPTDGAVDPVDTVVDPVDTVVDPGGACMSAEDQAIIVADRDGVTAEASTCGLGCMGDTDPVACSTPCVVTATGVTEGCAGCYAGMISCTIVGCIAECMADTQAQGCIDCQVDKGCFQGFYDCSGMVAEEE
jgi:hypothetical protein